jgi:superfamily I DNA and/or RNA helicase
MISNNYFSNWNKKSRNETNPNPTSNNLQKPSQIGFTRGSSCNTNKENPNKFIGNSIDPISILKIRPHDKSTNLYQLERTFFNHTFKRFLSPKYITNLLDKSDNELIDDLNKDDLITTINNTVLKEFLLINLTKVLRRVCLSYLAPAKIIMNYFLNSNYFKNLEIFLKEIKPKVEQQLINNTFEVTYKSLLEDIIVIFTEFYFKFTTSLSIMPFDNLKLLIETILKVNRVMQKLDNHKDLIDKFTELEKLNTELYANNLNKAIKEGTQLVNTVKVPITYIDEEILLTSEEIYLNKQPVLEAHRIKGSYESWERYFNTLFYLVREDGYRSLRDNIYHILNKGIDSKTIEKQNRDIYYYPEVNIVRIELGFDGLIFTLSFSTLRNRVNWHKRMLYGSLVILTDFDFSDFIMAVIVKNPFDMAKLIRSQQGAFCQISLVGMDYKNFEKLLKFYNKPLQMFESKAYFEAYKHILHRLKTINTRLLPFEDIFIHANSGINGIPSYLYRQIKIDDHLYALTEPLPKFNLDDSQYQAYKHALMNKVAILQGPPGTGKTYVGSLITRILLNNTSCPILIVCYTNHALDQFLKHISKFEDNIIRIGARCKDEQLQQFMLKNVKQTHRLRIKSNLFKINKEIHELSENGEFKEFLNCLSKGKYLQYETFVSLFPDVEDKLVRDFQILTDCVLNSTRGNREVYNLWATSNKRFLNKQIERIAKFVEIKYDIWEFYDKVHKLLKAKNNIENIKIDENTENNIEEEDEEDIRENLERMLDDGEEAKRKETYEELENLEHALLNKQDLESILKKNLWYLTEEAKVEITEYFKSTYINSHIHNMTIFSDIQNLIEKKKESESYIDACYIQKAKIVGMTTTGCAKYSAILDQVNFEIVIIEEAAEVLESHIAALLTRSLKHMILIGDHKQLKPKPYNFDIEMKYNFNVSFFERLINNGFPLKTLSYQRRMRPEFTDFVRLIYGEDYKDDPSTLNKPSIKGFKSNIYFINHNQLESNNESISSKVNEYEASFLTYLAKYIIGQNYNNITILTLYTGQLLCIRNKLKSLKLDKLVRVVTVDNYQGEEDDFILLSLVRSNKSKKIGFLKILNRVCVAFSRAKEGFFVVGNFDFLASCNDNWKRIYELAIKKEIISDKLTLCCQKHNNITVISKPENFINLPEGGCDLPCRERLECGHVCEFSCHNFEHSRKQCKKPCPKIRDCGHQCPKRCLDDCGKCEIKTFKILPCGHSGEYKCYLREKEIDCQANCSKVLLCGHPCKDKCYQKCNTNTCTFKIKKCLLCGHENEVECSIPASRAECRVKCGKILPCGHICKGTCGTCLKGTLHIPCEYECNRNLLCGHVCKQKCSQPCLCIKPCNNECSHAKCIDPCFAVCLECKEKCGNKCPHDRYCDKLCYELCAISPCDERCSLIMKCGHQCIGLCGEECPSLCRTCDPNNNAFDILFGNEDDPDALFYKLSCGHRFEVKGFDQHMSDIDKIQAKGCPLCKAVITQGNGYRYSNIIKITYGQVNKVKEKMLQVLGNYNNYYSILDEKLPKYNSNISKNLLTLFDNINKKDYNKICTIYNLSTFLEKLEQIETKFKKLTFNKSTVTDIFIINFETVSMYFKRLGDYNTHFLKQLNNKIDNFYVYMKIQSGDFSSNSINKIVALLQDSYFNIEETLLNDLMIKLDVQERRKAFIEIMNIATGTWYMCPNGHPYSVGDCGRPMESRECPECGVSIGGHAHRPMSGNVIVNNNNFNLNLDI